MKFWSIATVAALAAIAPWSTVRASSSNLRPHEEEPNAGLTTGVEAAGADIVVGDRQLQKACVQQGKKCCVTGPSGPTFCDAGTCNRNGSCFYF
ncbi:hypothetical protein ACA910_001156 [Epithemia clementina (nom. ined.)]